MIIIKTDNILTAVKEAYGDLLQGSANSSDSSMLKEDSAVLEIRAGQVPLKGFSIQNGKFTYDNDYQFYFPRIEKDLITEEEAHYSQLFLMNKSVESIVGCIKRMPDSRRNVISTWSPKYLDPAIVGVSITQLYFRLRDGALELHSHSRANDAYRLLLLDMQLAMCIQREVSERVGVKLGTYIHFSDSLHMYKRHQEDILWQHEFMKADAIWQV